MIFTLVIWSYIWFVLTGLGIIFDNISNLAIRNGEFSNTPNLLRYIFNGFCICMGICSILYFFSNIGLTVHLSIFLLTISSLFIFKKSWKAVIDHIRSIASNLSIWQWLLLLLTLFSILLASIPHPTNVDSGNYHVQSIQWINQHQIIPGIGNLIPHLAFNQSSFFVEAFFSFSFLGISPFRGINGFLALILISNIVTSINLKKATVQTISGAAIVIFFMFHYRYWLSSPTPDIIVALMTYYIFWISIQRFSNQITPKTDTVLISIYLVAFSALTVKLSALVLPLVALIIIVRTPLFFKTNKLSFYIIVPIIVMIPWLIRSVILSGYLVFPVAAVDLFDVDWKVPEMITTSAKNVIHGFATNPSMPPEKVMALPFMDRVIMWGGQTSWLRISLLIIIFIAQIVYAFLLVSKRKLSRQQKDLMLLGSTAFFGIVFWFVNAPDFRFGSALIYMALIILFIISPLKKKMNHRFFAATLVILSVVFLFRKIHIKDAIKHPLTWASYKVPDVKEVKGQGFSCAIPKEGFQCWNHQLPCIPFGNMSYIQQRGEDLEDGFRFVYPSKEN